MTPIVAPGFVDPVHDGQRTFRRILSAMSEPGSVVTVQAELPDLGCSSAAVACILTLADFDTPTWISPSVVADMSTYLRFHAGVPTAQDPHAAAFALVATPSDLPPLSAFNPGTAMSPEASTTIVLEVEDFDGGTPVHLTGPGLASPRQFSPKGISVELWTELQDNHARFPAGVDLVFCCGDKIVGLPRSTEVHVSYPVTTDEPATSIYQNL